MRLQLISRTYCTVPFPRKKFLFIFIILSILILSTIIFKRQKRHNVNVESSKSELVRTNNARQTEYVDSKGMHVVVGRYVGSDLSSKKPDLSDFEIDANRYDPRPGDGEDGQPVFLGIREERVGKRLWHINKFNILGNKEMTTIVFYLLERGRQIV